MTENSIETFHATKEMRSKNEKIVFEALLKHPRSSRFYIGRITGLGDIEAQRRLSDLVTNGSVVVTGKRKHGKNNVSLYSVKDQLELYPDKKKPPLRSWLKKKYPEILEEYRNA
jgi:predicted HTH transcriptional regulator